MMIRQHAVPSIPRSVNSTTSTHTSEYSDENERRGVEGGPLTHPINLRNSQAGTYKCELINPNTGKPCSKIISRPYDVPRHEDSIHNAEKQKVRCHLCTEEKTFSRNDGLTKHMRVEHPDVDWLGKTRRKKECAQTKAGLTRPKA
jgi:hypothetical protein